MAKAKKIKKPRLSFAQRFVEKIKHLGEIDCGILSDESGAWIELKVGDTGLVFSFDAKGENIDQIAMYKDKIEVVDQIQIWKTKE